MLRCKIEMQGPRTPEPQVAVIVGRGCEKLAEIEKRTGAKIALTRPAADRFREITLQGPDAVRMPTPRFTFFFPIRRWRLLDIPENRPANSKVPINFSISG